MAVGTVDVAATAWERLRRAAGGPAALRIFSFVLLLCVWSLATLADPSGQVLPAPWVVLDTMWYHLNEEGLLYHLSVTLWRVAAAFFGAMVIGVALGILMGARRRADIILDGWHILFLNMPALVLIILCYVWFGLTEVAAIVAVALNKIPNVVVTVREGTRAVDRELLDVARVFRVDRRTTFLRFFLPQLYPSIMAAARGGIALIWKIVLVVELLGRSNGVGFKLHEFFQLFDIAAVLAYTLAFVVVMMAVEYGVMAPLERRCTRWR